MGTLILILAWWLQTSMKVDIFLELVIIIFYVILPHTFLMNSAHNKDRMIDEGLKNIIRNALNMPFDTKSMLEILRKGIYRYCFKGEENIQERPNEDENTKHTSDEALNEKRKDIPMIYVVPEKEFDSAYTQKDVEITRNPLTEEKPSSSNGTCEENGPEHCPSPDTSLSADEVELIDRLSENNNRFLTSKKLLSYMADHVNEEQYYLHYFLQLIEYENKIKDKHPVEDFVILTAVEPVNITEKRKTSTKRKGKNRTNLIMKKDVKSVNFQVLSSQTMMLESESDAKLLDRIAMRKVMIESFNEHLCDEKSFDAYLNELIDFEEGLVGN